MKRIVIIGVTGSGKTTLGGKIALQLGIPQLDLDDLHWLPGWVMRDRAEFIRMAEDATDMPAWVVTGNYRAVSGMVWQRADTLIWIDYPFWRIFRQLLRRSLARIRGQSLICNGNTDSWGKFLSRDSIMIWLFQTYGRKKREYSAIFADAGLYPNLTYIRLRSPDEAQTFLQNLKVAP